LCVTCSVVFEFSKDVQELLKVLTSREEAMAERVRKLEALFSDWERIFGHPSADLVAAGVTREGARNTPEAVGRRLLELAASKSSLASSRTANSTTTPEAALIRTLQAELHDAHLALRDASRIAREQAAHDVLRMRKEADSAVAAERQARFNAERALLVEQQRAADELEKALQKTRDEAEARRQQDVAELQRQAEEANTKANDEKALLQLEMDSLKRELSRTQGELADERARASAEEARLVGERVDLQRLMENRLKKADDKLKKTEEAWSLRLQDAEDRYARCSSIKRMQGMETELQFLRARQKELEDVVIALQEALLKGSGVPSSLLPSATSTSSAKNPSKAGVVVAALRPTTAASASLASPLSAAAAAGPSGSSPVSRASSRSRSSKATKGHSASVAAVHHVGAAAAGAAVRKELTASKAVASLHPDFLASGSDSRKKKDDSGVVSSARVERHHHAVSPPALPPRIKASLADVLTALPGTATAWVVS
jgi:hypothetical protein